MFLNKYVHDEYYEFILDEYDLTNEFITSQKALFEKPQEELPDKIDLVNYYYQS